ncbi:MAG: hypothetical protein AMS23_01045 [Bacteroides sp. SM1_62]|nr:MAG: hypothetical protein AMS26_04745 [Bacteroides sp. SM23_62]KPL26635.1 MAG: hypothetical protein AMS23_01045 [Bacteroides sp. SM1_62]
MKKKIFYGLAALMVAVLLSSCSKAPQTEIDQANAAIDSAKAAGAEIYVPDAFAALQDSMNAVIIMIEEQDSKLIKSYADSKEKLAQISVMAREVALKSDTRREEIKTETLAILSEVKSLLEENKQLISAAPKGKEGTAALQAMKNELNVIETSVAEVEGMFAEGELLACHSKASAAKEKAQMMNTELTEVIAKYNKARR